MTKRELISELEKDPFEPFRIHLVSGKVFDVLGPNAAHTLANALLVLRNPTLGTTDAEGYDVLSYRNMERIEQLRIGRRPSSGRKRA